MRKVLAGISLVLSLPWSAQAFTLHGSTFTFVNGASYSTLSDIEIGSGAVVTNGAAISIGGNLESSGTFSAAASTLTFTSNTSGQIINVGRGTFYRMDFTGLGGWSTETTPLTVRSTLGLSSGTLTVDGSSVTIGGSLDVANTAALIINNDLGIAGGSLTNEGSITSANPAAGVRLIGGGNVGGSGATQLPSLSLPNAAQTTILAGALTVLGSLTNASGHTLDANTSGNYALTISSSFLNSGAYLARASSITFNGANSGLTIQSGNSPFYQLAFTGPGAWSTTSTPLTVTNAVEIAAGALTCASGSSMTVTGPLDVAAAGTLTIQNNLLLSGGTLTNAGTVNALATSTLTFSGSGTLGGNGATTLPHLLLTGSGQTTTLGGDISVLGQLALSSGHTLDAGAGGNYGITVSSNWINAGTFVPQTGTVEFNSTATLTGQTTFYNLSALTPGLTLTFPALSTQTVAGAVTFAGISTNLIKLRSSTNGSHWYLKGTGANSIYAVDVKDSVASANTMNASASTDSSNNVNWTFGTTRTWIGPGNWSVAGNWSPSGVPGGNDSTVFSNANNCTIDISTSVATVTIQSGYSGTITANQPLTLTGGYTQAGGAFNLASSTLTVGSNWSISGGVFTPGSGAVNLNAQSSGRTIKTAGRNFYALVFNGSGGYWTLQDSVTVRSSLTLAAGTLDTGVSGNYGISVGGEWLNPGGNFTANAATVTFTGGASALRVQSNGSAFGFLAFTGAGSWVTDNGPLLLTRDLTLSNGALTVVSGSSLTVNGQVTVSPSTTLTLQDDIGIGGGSLANSATVTTSGASTLTLSGTGTLGGSGYTSLGNLELSGNAKTTTLGGKLTLSGALTNDAGHTLDANAGGNYNITLSSSWVNSGVYRARTSSASFISSATGLILDTGGDPFYNLSFSGAGGWATANTPLIVSSNVIINGGNFTISAGSSLTVTDDVTVKGGAALTLNENVLINGGSLNNSGMVTTADASKTVTVAGAGTVGGTGATVLPSVDFSGFNQTSALSGALSVLGNLSIDSGHTLDAGASGNYGITVSSSWVNSGTYVSRLSSVTWNGTSPGMVLDSGNSPFYKLVMSGLGSLYTLNNPLTVSSAAFLNAGTFGVASGSTMTVTGNIIIGVGALLDMEGDVGIAGGSLGNSGGVTTASNAAVFSLTGSGILGGFGTTLLPRVNLSGNAQTTTLGGPLSLLGDLTIGSGHTLDASATGNFGITVSSSWANSGAYVARASSVSFNGSTTGLAINSGNSAFYTLAFTGSGSLYTATTPLTVANSVSIAAGTFGVGSSSLTVAGSVDVQSGATFDVQNNTLINGGSLTNAGTITSLASSSVTVVGTGNLGGSGNTTLPQLILNGSGQTTTLAGDISTQGQLTISSAHTLDANGSGNYQISVSSNWVGTGSFVARAGGVTFNSTATISGNNAFYNLASNTPGITLTFIAASTQTISGSLTLTGGAGNALALRSSVSGARVYFDCTGAAALTYLDVQDNSATGNALSASASNDSGNNLRWTFATTRIWKGTTSTSWNVATNWSPSGVPASVDSVSFDNTSSKNCSINATSTVADFTINGSNTRTISFSASTIKLNVAGDMTIGGGTFNQGSSAVTVGGSWNKSGGTYTVGTSSVTFNGAGAGNVISAGNTAFYKIAFVGPGQWSTAGTAVTVSSDVLMTAGALTVTSASSMTVAGNLVMRAAASLAIEGNLGINGGSLAGAGTVTATVPATLTLSGAGTLGGAGAMTLPAVTLMGSAQTTTLGGAVNLLGALTIGSGHTLDVNSASNYAITISSDWTNSGTFTAQTGSVTFNGSAILSGNSNFYDFNDSTPGTSLTFTAGSTQTITDQWVLAGASGNRITLDSTAASPWYLVLNGTATVSQVAVHESVAGPNLIYAGKPSQDNGQNINWVFDYLPGAISGWTATPDVNGNVMLAWNAPFDADDDPFGSGSQYAIEWATYTVVWSTSNIGDTGYAFTQHVYISTSGVSAGDPQVYVSTGLTGNISYGFRVWMQDPSGYWSAVSSSTGAAVTPVLSVIFSTNAYSFGMVNMGASTISTAAITVSNMANVVQTYSLSVSTTGALTVWQPTTGLPTTLDRFALFATFNATQPSISSFGSEDIVTSTPAAATSSVYSVGGETGIGVPQTVDRHLWLRFDMPPMTTTTDSQQMDVYISASTP